MKIYSNFARPVLYIVPLIVLFSSTGMIPGNRSLYQQASTETPSVTTTQTFQETLTPLSSISPSPTETATATATPDSVTSTAITQTPSLTQVTPTPSPSEVTEKEEETKKSVQLLVARESMPFFQAFSFNLFRASSCRLATELAKIGVVIEEIPSTDLDTTIDALMQDENVEYVEIVGEVRALDLIPNDPAYIYQSGLNLIGAPKAWEYSTGSSDVTIAVVDSGVDYSHPDLRQKLQTGCDFINEDGDASDDNGHGTHVAGIAAAIGGDGAGMAGVSWGANVLPVKVLDQNGVGNYATVAAGIIWATDHGVQIINISLGGEKNNRTLKAALDYATQNGVLVVASSGNDGVSGLMYPAAYDDVISVGSVDLSFQRSIFSNYGRNLDLVAPGESVYSSVPGGYAMKSGTSMSAPYVSGLAAILWGLPGNGNARMVEIEMERSARDLGVLGRDDYFGYGLIRMDYALRDVLFPATASPSPTSTLTVTKTKLPPGDNFVITATPADLGSDTSIEMAYDQAKNHPQVLPSEQSSPVVVFIQPVTATPAMAIETKEPIHLSAFTYIALSLLGLGCAGYIWYKKQNKQLL